MLPLDYAFSSILQFNVVKLHSGLHKAVELLHHWPIRSTRLVHEKRRTANEPKKDIVPCGETSIPSCEVETFFGWGVSDALIRLKGGGELKNGSFLIPIICEFVILIEKDNRRFQAIIGTKREVGSHLFHL